MRWLQTIPFRWKAIVALVLLSTCYICHFIFCARSALPEFSEYFLNSDMHANLLWARGIVEQGWLNPHPYHPYNNWMQQIAPYQTWLTWWGGESVFQQSPLPVYLLALFLKFSSNLLFFHFFQCLLTILLCVFLGILTAITFENRSAGWVAFVMASLYGPFYGYSWPLLRDCVGWLLIVTSLLTLTLWWRSWRKGIPSRFISIGAGISLGLGLLARETFYLTIPLACICLLIKSVQKKIYSPFIFAILSTLLTISPLVIRNAEVGAPLLSSSNRFAECFILGNTASSHPSLFYLPPEMGDIFQQSGGKPLKTIYGTLATHQKAPWHFLSLQAQKILSLFDPFEAPDSLNLYFMEEISPFVRWGLPHWFILIPGLGGFLLGFAKRDRRHIWLLLFGITLLAGFLINPALSRFRQSLVLLWIPWAGYFTAWVWNAFQEKCRFRLTIAILFLFTGWWLCLGPLAIHPRNAYYRPMEYRLAAFIYEKNGQKGKAKEILECFENKIQSSK